MKALAIEDYHRDPDCSDLLLFFGRSREWSSAFYAPRLLLATVHLSELHIIEKGTDLFFYHCPLLAGSCLSPNGRSRPKADAHTLRSRPNANVLDQLIVLDIYNVAGINTEADNEVRSSEKSRHARSPEVL